MKLNLSFLFVLIFNFLNAQNNKPNILWIVCEDSSPNYSFYGDATAKTPNLDALAAESIIYENAFATTPVCAPSRSAIITGMLPNSIGTMHMRTGKHGSSLGTLKYKDTVKDHLGNLVKDLNGKLIREYSAVIPENVKCFTEYLRANNYYCTNNQKTDYQFEPPQSAWDENNAKAHWRNAPKGMPFFSVFNCDETHESKIWETKSALTVNPNSVPVPDYFPDNAVVRNDIARYYSNIELLDKKVGELIAELKKDGLYDQTIIFFYSDHGGPLPRQKREIYDSGLKVPLLVRFPNGKFQSRNSDMISFADLAPTVLSLAEIVPPSYLDGSVFLGKYKTKKREVIYATSDRFDDFTDRIRIVRDQQFLYVKNYYPQLPKYKNIFYRLSMPLMMNILENREKNQLNASQSYWFESKTKEELYDCLNDPYQLHNLASNPVYSKKLQELRKLVVNQFENKTDYGAINEADLIQKMWPNGIQPQTEKVIITNENGKVKLESKTKGASISYIILPKNSKEKITNNSRWKLYTTPFALDSNSKIDTKAARIGYKESEISEWTR